MRWLYHPPSADAVAALGHAAGVGPLLAELLLRRGLGDPASAARFMDPTLAGLGDPFLLHNLEAAASRLRKAIAGRESVAVLGDYDVDGVSSTALLVGLLRRFGLSPRFVVPRRLEDGYGLSRSAIDRALEAGRPDLFIALDCGTNSHAETAYLQGLGIDVIVIDHHRSKDLPLAGGLLINPHVNGKGDEEPWRHLCTVGLVFKLAHGLLKLLRQDRDPIAMRIRLRDYLDFVALGTVADLVPLLGENRILARHGLGILQAAERPGLRALMQIAGVRAGQPLMPADVSFRLGPRINASGRLADAALSVELMLSEDDRFCFATAHQLDAFNRERQDIERAITEEADRMIETEFLSLPGIVLYSDAWHPGVVGIVAGRVTRKYHRPCVVLGKEGELGKGSGRSIEGINLVEVLATCCEHLTSWGGHPMAVGIAMRSENLAAFRAQFAAAVGIAIGANPVEPGLEIAAWLAPERIDAALMDELEKLHPFGQGNPEPVFGLRGVVLRQRPEVFKLRHFRFTIEAGVGRRLHGVAWKMAERIPPAGVPLDFAVELAWNFYNDRRMLQLELIDWRPSQPA